MKNIESGLGAIRAGEGRFKLGAKVAGGVFVFGEDNEAERRPSSAGQRRGAAGQTNSGTAIRAQPFN